MVALAARVQLPAGANVPVELVVKLTDPVGVVGVADVSVTVAVQLVPWFTTTDDGLQLTDMVVEWTETPTGRLKLLELPECLESPAYVAGKRGGSGKRGDLGGRRIIEKEEEPADRAQVAAGEKVPGGLASKG